MMIHKVYLKRNCWLSYPDLLVLGDSFCKTNRILVLFMMCTSELGDVKIYLYWNFFAMTISTDFLCRDKSLDFFAMTSKSNEKTIIYVVSFTFEWEPTDHRMIAVGCIVLSIKMYNSLLLCSTSYENE